MDEKTINFVMSSRNREIKSAYSISASRDKGFVVDCDPGRHGTNLTTFLEEIMAVAGIYPEEYDKSKPIQLKCGGIWFPPIVMNDKFGIDKSMEMLSFDLKRLYGERRGSFLLSLNRIEIAQFGGNIMGSVYRPLGRKDAKFSYNHVFLDCSGNLLANGTSILKNSILNIREDFLDFKIIFHYIVRVREVVGQEYYNENSNERRRDFLCYCIQQDLNNNLDISFKEIEELNNGVLEERKCESKSPSMAMLIDGIVLVFNLHNERESIKDKLFGDILESDLINISNELRWTIPKLREIYIMKTCKKLLGSSRKYHERIFDYLIASIDELPNRCLIQLR